MFIFLQTVKCTPGEDTLGQCSEDHQYAYPRWMTDYSIIGKSPGLGLRPKQSEDLIDSALITFNTDDNQEGDKVENWKDWDKRIKYFPKTQGFPNYYFPYTAQPDYLSPLIAVQFNVAKNIGQLIHIECRAFAKNIGYNRRDKIGISVFEIQVHDSTSVPKM